LNSKEVVLRTIEFTGPSRIALAKGEDPDVLGVGYRAAADFAPAKRGMDEWGCVWRSLRPGSGDKGQVVQHPLADWNRFSEYRFPDPFAKGRFDHLKAWLEENAAVREDTFVFGYLGAGPMHRLDYLRGFEDYLIDIVQNRERVEAMLDGLFHFLEGIAEQYAQYGLDAVFLTDDQATQEGPLFSMKLWREVLGPRFERLFRLVHEAGMKVWLHSCGNISQHLVDLLQIGVDIVDNKQPALWMHADAAREVRGRMAFSTCLDIQTTIHRIPLEEVEHEVSKLIRQLSVPQGGFVATMYNSPDLRLPREKVARMWEAFQAFRW